MDKSTEKEDKSSEALKTIGNEICCVWESLHSLIKVASPDLANNMDLEKDKKTLPKLNLISPPSFAEQEKLYLSRELRQMRRAEIARERSEKKFEKVMMNRELPVVKEALCSGASKDAFDLKDLNESLPSTSEQKSSDIESYPPWLKQNYGSSGRLRCSISSYSSRLDRKLRQLNAMPIPSLTEFCYLGIENNIKSASFRHSVQMEKEQRRIRRAEFKERHKQMDKRLAKLEESIKIIKAENEAFLKSKAQESDSFTAPHPTIAEVPPGDKLKEKSSDGEIKLPNIELPPFSSWDSEKKRITEFDEPQSSVHFNSPTKWNVNFDDTKPVMTFNEMFKERHRENLKLHREEKKLQKLNSQRGVLSEDMDEPECEKTTSKPDMESSHFARAHLREMRVLRNTLNSGKEQMEAIEHEHELLSFMLMMKVREFSKSIRSVRSHRSSGNTDPDKVLPD